MRRIKIVSTAKYLPRNKVTAAEIDKKIGEKEGWVANKSGVLVRHFASEDETSPVMGAIALKEGDIKKAETLFGAAAGAGNEVNYNLGIVSMKNAEYDKAVKYFVKDEDVNSALAKMMAGNNNGALQDLEAFNMPNCFMKEYLKAVIGARTAKENLLFESLEKAVSINPEMKAKARNDMEFARYFENPKFKEIVK